MADGAGATEFLGVARSLAGRAWRRRSADPDWVRGHIQGQGLSEPLARALAARGVRPEEARDFLEPRLKQAFPDPSSFVDMDAAARAIVDAVERRTRITILADYDVDGATSAALLIRWLRAVGTEAELYVPDRLNEGYGPSPRAFDAIKAGDAGLVITVDCGAAAYDAIAHACRIDLKVVVVDHHLMQGAPPACLAVVNPNRSDCGSGQGHLAAAGVVFVLLAALNREARARDLFKARAEPDIRAWMDLAALGAICDVTALRGFNRALTKRGLEVMSRWDNPGMQALLRVAGQDPTKAKVDHAGFVLGPRINAGGRIGRSDLGARLLATDDPAEAAALAEELDALNQSRREVEREVIDQAVRRVEAAGHHADDTACVVVAGEGWHPGVVGIVAGRLRERWRKPVIVIGLDRATGIGKGSGRSQAGMNLGRAVQAAFEAGVLMGGGGHAMAAGLTVRSERLDALRDFLNARLAPERAATADADDLCIDVLLSPAEAHRDLLDQFEALAPFGPGNPEPMFALAGVTARDAVAMTGGHVRCRLVAPDGSGVRAIAWRVADVPLGKALLAGQGGLHVAGRLKPDDWNGRRGVQFVIEDVADPRMVVG